MTKKLIAISPGGIASRIKCLISLWRLSDKFDAKLYVYWKRNNVCGAEFNQLFENKFHLISKGELETLSKEDCIISETWRLLTFPDEIPDNFAEVYPTKRGNNIDFEFNKIPIYVRENILFYINRLKPIKVISSIVDKFTEKYDVSNLIGVHIRRGDFLDGKDGLGKVSPTAKFIEKIHEVLWINPSSRFFLCTDCQQTEDKLKNEFGDKIIIYPKKSLDRASILAIQQGLVDLLLLSKTKHIIGTYFSTFTELAWWFGGCKAKINMIIDEGLKERYEIKKEKLSKSKYEKLKIFVYKILCKMRLFKK